jgi:hypothetical protein
MRLRLFEMSARLAAVAALAVSACAPASSPSSPSPASSAEAPAGDAPPAALRYEVSAGLGAAEVTVEAVLPKGTSPELSIESGAEPFLRDVTVQRGEAFERIEREGASASWFIPSCAEQGCRLRYRFLLAEAAGAIDDFGIASEHGGVLLAPPSTWLLRPLRARAGSGAEEQPYRFRVTTPPGLEFVTGVFPAEDGAKDTYGADLTDLPEAPFSAFGPVRTTRIKIPGGEVLLAIAPGDLDEPDDVLAAWVASAADTVARYFGRFPVRWALVVVLPTGEGRLGYARTLGNGGASIVAPVGRGTRREDFIDDWVMTHEMVHLGFPNVPRYQSWIEEGIATYVEPIARARLGKLSVEEVWRDLARGLPRGQPEAGDQGLDRTRTWGRTYWGGALFCLLADIEIRERTGNRRSLDDALRAIVKEGGTVAERWPLERALDVGDRATGVPVLRELHAKMGPTPVTVDLEAVWAKLGVKVVRRQVTFNEAAPLAAIRRSITERSSERPTERPARPPRL